MGKSELDQPTGTLWAHSSHWSQRKDVDIWGTQQHFQQLELLLRKVPGVNLFTFQLELCSSNSPAVWLSLISNGVFIFIQRWTALDPRRVFLYDGSSRTSALLSLSRSAKATWMMYTTCTPRRRMIWFDENSYIFVHVRNTLVSYTLWWNSKRAGPAPRMVKKTSLTTALNQETEQGKSRGKPNPAEQKAPWPSKWMFEIPHGALSSTLAAVSWLNVPCFSWPTLTI